MPGDVLDEWKECEARDAVHRWFSLTYANYLTIPRSVLQSMPGAWQLRFVELLEEMERLLHAHGIEYSDTVVQVRGTKGRFEHDPFADYERGRRDVFAEAARRQRLAGQDQGGERG